MFGISSALFFIILIIAIAWLYDFYNGANDAANAIATTVSTRVLSPVQAILLAAILNGAGAFITTRVAKTIGKGIVDPKFLTGAVLISALIGAIVWAALATHKGWPVSITHSLVGGIIGAVWVPYGLHIIKSAGIIKILLGMVFSPILGFIFGVLLLNLLYRISHKLKPSTTQKLYGKLQLISASFMALSHGTNDTQNAMGIITVALFTGGFITQFEVPTWVILGSGFFMALGTYVGGKKVIRTLGMKLAKIKPVHGFAAETSAVGVIMGATALGIPISTTHAIASSVTGVGAVDRIHGVRWNVAKEILGAWIFTIPGAMVSSAVVYLVLKLFI